MYYNCITFLWEKTMQQEEINYNQYLIDNITHYLVTTFLGRGQYAKIEF